MPLAHSTSPSQTPPPHFLQGPPQSTPSSPWFCLPSLQLMDALPPLPPSPTTLPPAPPPPPFAIPAWPMPAAADSSPPCPPCEKFPPEPRSPPLPAPARTPPLPFPACERPAFDCIGSPAEFAPPGPKVVLPAAPPTVARVATSVPTSHAPDSRPSTASEGVK